MLPLTGYYLLRNGDFRLKGTVEGWQQLLAVIDSPALFYEDNLIAPDKKLDDPDWGYFTRIRLTVAEGLLVFSQEETTLTISGAKGFYLLGTLIAAGIQNVRRTGSDMHEDIDPVTFGADLAEHSAAITIQFIAASTAQHSPTPR